MRTDSPTANPTGRAQLRPIDGGKSAACREVEELLAGQAESSLAAADAATVSAHLRECPACTADVRAFRAILTDLRTRAEMDKPLKDQAFWHDLQQRIALEVAGQPANRRWWQKPALRWGMLAAAAVLLAVVGLPRLLPEAPAVEEARDNRAVYGTASELVRSDRGFVDDLAGSDGDPAQTLDELDDWEEIDLDALGTALDDQAEGEQGAQGPQERQIDRFGASDVLGVRIGELGDRSGGLWEGNEPLLVGQNREEG